MPLKPDKVLITAALLYANGALHFGHLAGAYLAADAYARFERMRGSDVLFLSGSDEYGVAIALSAELAGRSPVEHVDLYHKSNQELFSKLNFSFNHYSRTSWEGHRIPVLQYFNDLQENGFVEKRATEQLYSPEEKRFLADRYVIGGCPRCRFDAARGDECPKCGASYEATDLIAPRSRLSNASLTKKTTTHWFLLLDKLAPKVNEWIATKRWKPTVLNFLKHYLDNPLPRAITRDGTWGVPVPGEEGKVFYVWFEAPIGYISAAIEWAEKSGNPLAWQEYWFDPKTKLVQFIGKDNIYFHGIFFPAMTMGQNLPYKIVDELPANEFLNLEGRQFSKSDNWTIDLTDILTRYSPDQLRYTLAANAPESSDAEFTFKDLQLRCNGELVGKYGNLANRSLVFASAKCGGVIPPATLQPRDLLFLDQLAALTAQVQEAYSSFRLRRVCQLIMEISSLGNAYFDEKKPWATAKHEETLPDMQTTIHCSLLALKALAVVAKPIMPQTTEKLWALLGLDPSLHTHWDEALNLPLTVGHPLPTPTPLFSKISDEEIAAELAKLHGGGNYLG